MTSDVGLVDLDFGENDPFAEPAVGFRTLELEQAGFS
jgi:hypothetical protein